MDIKQLSLEEKFSLLSDEERLILSNGIDRILALEENGEASDEAVQAILSECKSKCLDLNRPHQ